MTFHSGVDEIFRVCRQKVSFVEGILEASVRIESPQISVDDRLWQL